MIKDCKQGDIFEVGNYGDFQYILVFAPHGMQLQSSWRRFGEKYINLAGINDPYDQLSTPTEFTSGRWIQFIESTQGINGMSDTEFEKALTKAFSWALENGISKVITTGIRDIPFDLPEEQRVEFIKMICSKKDYDQLKITLISKDKAYLGKQRNMYDRHFLSEPKDNEVVAKVRDEKNEQYCPDKIEKNEIELLKEFYVVAVPQASQMKYIVHQMRETLHGLINKKIPNDINYTTADLKKYCESLVLGQNNNTRPSTFGYWSTANNISDIPRDLKDSCLYFPSIIAVATLARIVLDAPVMALTTWGFGQALRHGLSSCLRNPIIGTLLPPAYGGRYFMHDYFIESIELLCKGGVIHILKSYQDYSNDRLKVVFEELVIRLRKDLECGYIKRKTNADYAAKCQAVLELLMMENG